MRVINFARSECELSKHLRLVINLPVDMGRKELVESPTGKRCGNIFSIFMRGSFLFDSKFHLILFLFTYIHMSVFIRILTAISLGSLFS